MWAMGTSNPARLLGLGVKGTIRVGVDADLVLWDQAGDGPRVGATWLGGRCVYDSTPEGISREASRSRRGII